MPHRNGLLYLGLTITLGLANGCVTVSATTTPGVQLSQFRSFGWHTPANSTARALAQSPAGQTIKQQIASDLVAKGLKEDPSAPDFLVAYHVVLADQYYLYPGFWGYGWQGGPVPVAEYTIGTIVIDFIDPKTHNAFWRGTAQGVAGDPVNPNLKKVASAVSRIMQKYPVQMASAPVPPPM